MWKYLCFQVWTLETVNYSSVHIKGTVSYSSFLPDWDHRIKKIPGKDSSKIHRSNKKWCLFYTSTHSLVRNEDMGHESMSPYPTSVGHFLPTTHMVCAGEARNEKVSQILKAEAVPLDLLRRYGMWCWPYNLLQMQRECKHVRCCPSHFFREDMWSVS